MRFSHPYGFYELNPFPGSNQIVVSNHAFIYPQFRNNGYGKQAAEERIEKARDLGFDYMLCTVRADNPAQLKIIRGLGWKELDRFTSTETGNEIILFGKNVPERTFFGNKLPEMGS